MKLTTKDLKSVRGLLYKVREKWYDIGIELEIDIDELNIIRKRSHDNPADCLVEMLQLWLKSVDPYPTWKILADALRAEAINEVELAEKAAARATTAPGIQGSQIEADGTEADADDPQNAAGPIEGERPLQPPAKNIPTLPSLICFPMADRKVNLAEEIAENYFEFGVLLLDDADGHRISVLEKELGKKASDINRQVFQLWLQGRGRLPVSWDTLTDVLRDIRLNKLANDIEEIKHH